APRRTERTREMGDRIHLGEARRPDLKFRRAFPVAALQQVPCRAGGKVESPGANLRIEALDLSHLVDNVARLPVLGELEMGIDQVIHAMELIVQLLVGFRGPDAGRM